MKIMAFGHRKRMGKDTLVRLITTRLRLANTRLRVEIGGFADIVKDVSYQMYSWAGLQRKEYYDSNEAARSVILPKINKTPRDVWIAVGNHMRLMDEEIWANALLKRLDTDVLLINDIRFPTEIDAVKSLGGVLVKITKPDVTIEDDAADGVLKDFTGWDVEINNNGTKADLDGWAAQLIKQYHLNERD